MRVDTNILSDCVLTCEGLCDFFLPDAKKFFAMGLALDQFPLTFPFFVQNALELILGAGYAVDDAGS